MPFTFKLSQRLARMRRQGLLAPASGLSIAAVVSPNVLAHLHHQATAFPALARTAGTAKFFDTWLRMPGRRWKSVTGARMSTPTVAFIDSPRSCAGTNDRCKAIGINLLSQ
jgi:hypothetical protein